MAATDEQVLKLFTDIKEVCINVIKDAHIFIGTHELKGDSFLGGKYPGLWTDIFYDDKYYKEVRDKIPVLKYKISKYAMRSYPEDKKFYSGIFEAYRTEHMDLKNYKKIDEIIKWINSEKEILKFFTDREKLSDYVIRGVVNDIVERYLYMTNATEEIPDDIETILKPFIAERLLFYLEDTLCFDICIPICLATFDKEIKLNEKCE